MITSFLQLLEKRYKDQLDQDANEFIGFAVDGAKRLDDMIKDLLEFSKVTQKKIEFKKVDINKVLEQTKLNLKYAIDVNNAEINYNTLPNIYGDMMLIELLFIPEHHKQLHKI
jgi:light-regulated signal transduction histidine kinase (bacteriophytochrome)